MKINDEIRDVVIKYLIEHPQSTALDVGKELNQHFSELPALRKTGNQALYRMEKEGSVGITDHLGNKPLWDITNRKEDELAVTNGKDDELVVKKISKLKVSKTSIKKECEINATANTKDNTELTRKNVVPVGERQIPGK